VGAEVDAALAEYDDGRMRAADVRSAADGTWPEDESEESGQVNR
jgi:hypothetical protein